MLVLGLFQNIVLITNLLRAKRSMGFDNVTIILDPNMKYSQIDSSHFRFTNNSISFNVVQPQFFISLFSPNNQNKNFLPFSVLVIEINTIAINITIGIIPIIIVQNLGSNIGE